jgi:hypothetical protein
LFFSRYDTAMDNSICAIINAFPSRQAAADAIGVPRLVVNNWVRDKAVPAKYLHALLLAGRAVGIKIKAEDFLAEIAKPYIAGKTR